MKFLGVGKVTKKDGVVTERHYIVDITEDEADRIMGIAGRPHISNRYRPGVNVNISAIYDKVKRINDRYAEIIVAATEVKSDADDIVNALPLT